jgi:hypothetical protein
MKSIEGKKKRAMLCFFLLWAGFSMTAFGQPGDPGTDPDVPISGIEWLLLGGGLLGVRKIFKRIQKV